MSAGEGREFEHAVCDETDQNADRNGAGRGSIGDQAAYDITIVSVTEFAGVDEPGAEPLVGDGEDVLIPIGGDVMIYGTGGAGKTTLTIDLAMHLGGGQEWLGFGVPKPVRVLIIEREGPRALFRRKLRRKLAGWLEPIDDRVAVFEKPWGEFTFSDERWRQSLAAAIAELEIDVLIAGPLTRLGMDEAGTLQQVRAFMATVDDLRRRSRRPLTVILVHHENKNGTVSGAWEGMGDTLLHIKGRGHGKTAMEVQKARWGSEYHGKTFDLVWTNGESFELEVERDYVAEIRELLSKRPWRTETEIAAPTKKGGIGARRDTVKETLEENPDTFRERTGDEAVALGRRHSAIVYGLHDSPVPDPEGAPVSNPEDGRPCPAPEVAPPSGTTGATLGISGPSEKVGGGGCPVVPSLEGQPPPEQGTTLQTHARTELAQAVEQPPDHDPFSEGRDSTRRSAHLSGRDAWEQDPFSESRDGTRRGTHAPQDGAISNPRCVCPDPDLNKDRVCLRCRGLRAEDDELSHWAEGSD